MSGQSFGKAFAVGLVVYIGLNVLLQIIYFVAIDQLELYFDLLEQEPAFILELLFGPITAAPYYGTTEITRVVGGDDAKYILNGLRYLIPGILATVASARLAESKYESFGAWALVALISFVLCLIYVLRYFDLMGWDFDETAIVNLIMILLLNLGFYGFFAVIASKNEAY
ncbi:MAG: hypothetical protein ACFFAS_16235 [Promethearchaeota archaeon]